jgi:hypothetical protein
LKAELEASVINSIGAKVQHLGEPSKDTPVLRGSSTLDWDDLQWVKAA